MVSGASGLGQRRGMPWRAIGWGGLGLLLVLPYVAGAP